MDVRPRGGFLLKLAERHFDDLEERLSQELPFTDVVDRSVLLTAVQPCIVITNTERVVAAGRLLRGGQFATTARSVKLIEAQLIGPWHLEVVLARMPDRSGRWVREHLESSVVPPATWIDLVDAIVSLDADVAPVLEQPSARRTVGETSTQIEERDAVLLCFDLAGLERPRQELPIDPGVHFLSGAEAVPMLEEHIVNHDALAGLPGWDRDIDPPRAFGFSDSDGRRLTVANVGGDKPELMLGVDLIYWREAPDSFVLVQYKRMRREAGGWRYRPSGDSNFGKELARMRAVMGDLAKLAAPTTQASAYRLMDEPFFFKFCHPVQTERRGDVLLPGLYVPLTYWEVMEKSGVLSGPDGGIWIGFDNAPKWITNSLFAELVADAWLGTTGLASAHVASLIRSSLGLGRAVVVGIEHPRPAGSSKRTRKQPIRPNASDRGSHKAGQLF